MKKLEASKTNAHEASSQAITSEDLKLAYTLGREHKNVLTQQLLQQQGWGNAKILGIFNRLIESRICALRKHASTSESTASDLQGKIWCKLRSEEVIPKLKQLDPDDYRVYCVIEESAQNGIWTADIRKQTNLQSHQVQKAVKLLCEIKRLIKPVRNIHIKNRKMYMLTELEPSKEIAGGSFYVNGEFNLHQVEFLRDQISRYLMNGRAASLKELLTFISGCGDIENHNVSQEDLLAVIRTLELEMKVHQVSSSNTDEPSFVWRPYSTRKSIFKTIPCGSCPVYQDCTIGQDNEISPENCKYFSFWLGYEVDIVNEYKISEN